MLNQILAGAAVSFLNFGIHAVITGLVVIITRHIAWRTDDLHVFMRICALLLSTLAVLTVAHLVEIAVWAGFYALAGINFQSGNAFEFAFENYTALGYGDIIALDGWRLIGPITALNGLLLIGWSVAIIFEIMKMADIHVGVRADRG